MASARTSNSQYSGLIPPALFKFNHLERHVQTHLRNVYTSLAIGVLAAAGGSFLHTYTRLGEWALLTSLVSIGLMLWLGATRHTKEQIPTRVGIFTAFTFTSGVSMGPLLEAVWTIDPSIISTALAGTAVVFISFTFAALLSRNRAFLYMGGFLMSGLSWLMLTGFLNIFFGSNLLFNVQLYGGLFLFCAFVLYDTQLIVEKRRMGDEDFIWHSVSLFLDAVNIFKHLLVILAKKDDGKKKNRE